jgi:hypothetical protein
MEEVFKLIIGIQIFLNVVGIIGIFVVIHLKRQIALEEETPQTS